MNFIGHDNKFNNYIRSRIITDYTVVSNVGGKCTDTLLGDKFILLMPIDSEHEFTENTGIGYTKMLDSAILDGSKIYTTIYMFMHKHIDPSTIVDIINTFDKTNLVDNIWVYPKLENHIVRDNKVENLHWQKLNRN